MRDGRWMAVHYHELPDRYRPSQKKPVIHHRSPSGKGPSLEHLGMPLESKLRRPVPMHLSADLLVVRTSNVIFMEKLP